MHVCMYVFMCVSGYERASIGACVRASVRAYMHACMYCIVM